MTLVRNRRQPLNGSKLIILLILAIAMGCKAKKSGVPPYQPPSESPENHERAELHSKCEQGCFLPAALFGACPTNLQGAQPVRSAA
jgi:hypothetical protein